MGCKHKFYEDLIPKESNIRFLVVGTFNPETEGNEAEYFYGRKSNLFWCICPHAFNDNCLIDKGPEEWKAFCLQHGISVTDIVKEAKNANLQNEVHQKQIESYRDKDLDTFELDFNTTSIISAITQNAESLNGVFFTRKSCGGIPNIWKEWQSIKRKCEELNIYSAGLPTPSGWGETIVGSIGIWREEINNAAKLYNKLS